MSPTSQNISQKFIRSSLLLFQKQGYQFEIEKEKSCMKLRLLALLNLCGKIFLQCHCYEAIIRACLHTNTVFRQTNCFDRSKKIRLNALFGKVKIELIIDTELQDEPVFGRKRPDNHAWFLLGIGTDVMWCNYCTACQVETWTWWAIAAATAEGRFINSKHKRFFAKQNDENKYMNYVVHVCIIKQCLVACMPWMAWFVWTPD